MSDVGREVYRPAGGILQAGFTRLVVWLLVASYAAFFSIVCAIKYRFFLYTDFDLAIFAQALDGLLHGRVFSSIRGMNWLGDHASWSLFLLLPIYAVFRHPLTLLVIQSAALAAGGLAVDRLARREGLGPGQAACAVAVYLLFPALAFTNLFEFHPETLATAPLLFAFDALRAGRTRALLAWTALALLAKEDVALAVLGMAAYALLARGSPHRLRHAAWLGSIALASMLVSFVVMRSLNGGQAEYGRFYEAWGSSTAEVIANLLTHPLRAAAALIATPGDPVDTRLKQELLLQLVLPVAFLPLASPAALIPALPVFAEHMLSSRPGDHRIVFQYSALITPFVIASAVLGWSRLDRLLGRTPRRRSGRVVPGRGPAWLGGIALACACLAQILFGPFGLGVLGRRSPESNFPDGLDRALTPRRERLLQLLPARGGVVASFDFLTRLTGRADAHSLHHVLLGAYTNSRKPYPLPRTIRGLIADASLAGTEYAELGSAERLRALCVANHLHPRARAGDLVLFTGDPGDTVELVTTTDAPRPAQRLVYDGRLEFEGVDLPPARVKAGEEVTAPTAWRALASLDRHALMRMMLVDRRGRETPLAIHVLGTPFHPAHDWPLDRGVRDVVRVILPLDVAPGPHALAFRLFWRSDDDETALAEADDPEVRSRMGLVPLGVIEVTR